MYTIAVTDDGQITIPSEIRQQLGILTGGHVSLEIRDGILTLTPVFNDIQAAFGLLKARKSVSLEEMEQAIGQAAIESDG